jgi:hypothetical protein
MADTSVDTVNKVLGYGALGFGLAGIVAPRALRRAYGMTADGPELTYLGRMWGTRTAVVGVLSLMASTDEERRRTTMVAIGMNLLDSMTAATTDGLPAATRVMGALTSAGFGAAGVYSVMNS